MNLTIDNLDGLGAVDYSAAVDASQPLTIVRTLNRPTLLKTVLTLAGTALRTPVRQARVRVTADPGVILFTGYMTVEPVAVYAGVASEGPVYRLTVTAVSDEWLLDKQAGGLRPGAAFQTEAGLVLGELAGRIAPGLLNAKGLAGGQLVGVFEPFDEAAGLGAGLAQPGAWSAHAGQLAASTYAGYRASNGTLTLVPGAGVTHLLNDGDGSLTVAGLRQSAVRELANDVTVSGAQAPGAYWTELFAGDGTTAVFSPAGEPAAPSSGHAVLIDDSFAGTVLNPNTWALTDPGSHLSLNGASSTGGGLTFNGGNGLNGQTTVLARDQVELGGTLVFELNGVTVSPGSAGVLCGLYAGTAVMANCVAGFMVTQAAGQTMVQPLINGMVSGTAYVLAEGHFYTLRLHLHAPELLRAKQTYYTLAGISAGVNQGAAIPQVVSFGGGLVESPLSLVFVLRDQGASSNTPVTVLYDGQMASAPARATLAVVNALEMFGSVAAVSVVRSGTLWITSTPPGSSSAARLAGKAGLGLDCAVSTGVGGAITFAAGRVPAAGEAVVLRYRGRQRAVARVADPVSLAAEAAGGAVGTSRWVGRVVAPVARSAEDCENAAAAILSFATNRAAAVSGVYQAVWPLDAGAADVWPGDLLSFPTAASAAVDASSAIARAVTITSHNARPEALTYKVDFANDWAEGLGIRLTEALAKDALVPATALHLIAPTAAGNTSTLPVHVLANLNQVTVVGAANALSVDAGVDAPAGGGFEVRRHDGGFGSGTAASAGGGDLVLRSPVRGFQIPRMQVEETFFVRMYDASVPRLFSRVSSAIVTHLPLS